MSASILREPVKALFASVVLVSFCVGLFGGLYIGQRQPNAASYWGPGAGAAQSSIAPSTQSGHDRDPPVFTDIYEQANNPLSPIKFDAQVNEYQLVYASESSGVWYTSYFPMLYCPWTGQKLPPSTRPDALLSLDVSNRVHLEYIPRQVGREKKP